MNYLGIEYKIENKPLLDESFVPFGVWMEAYLKEAEHPFSVAIQRDKGAVSVFHSFLRDDAFSEANDRYVERLVKFLLWSTVRQKGLKKLIKRVMRAPLTRASWRTSMSVHLKS